MAPVRFDRLPAVNKTFVNRLSSKRAFEEAVFSIPSNKTTIKIFYGIGGQGKTALMADLLSNSDIKYDKSYSFL